MEELEEKNGDYIFDKYETTYLSIQQIVRECLEYEPLQVREAVIERLSDEFRFWYIFD